MALLRILVLFNFVLVVFNFVFIIRNFFINYKGSNKLYINIIVILLLVISVIIGASCVIEGKRGINIIKALNDPDGFKLTKKKIQIYQKNLGLISDRMPHNTIMAYVISVVGYLLLFNIQRKRKKEIRKTGGWDYEKIKEQNFK